MAGGRLPVSQFPRQSPLARLGDELLLSVDDFRLGVAASRRRLQGAHVLHPSLCSAEHIRARVHQVRHLGGVLLLLNRLQMLLHVGRRDAPCAPGSRSFRCIFDLLSGHRL